MRRTYVDASVLIAAFRGEPAEAARALAVLDDPDRRLVVSDFLRLEVLPKPTYHGRQDEVEFMSRVLEGASESAAACPELTTRAIQLAARYDMRPLDSLHAAAAALAAVDDLVTMERPTSPLCRVEEVTVVSLHSDSGCGETR